MTDRAELAKFFTWEDDPGFLDFMVRADRVIASRAAGMGVLDFADACWADLYEEDPDCSDEAICETLADADDLFASMLELANG